MDKQTQIATGEEEGKIIKMQIVFLMEILAWKWKIDQDAAAILTDTF